MESSKEIVLDAFMQAVGLTFRELAGLDVIPRGVTTGRFVGTSGISAVLRLTPAVEGEFALDFPLSVATELTRRIFVTAGADVDEAEVSDCIGEVANVVAGQAKTLLVGTPHHFVFSIPVVTATSGPQPQVDCTCVEFGTEIGEFTLYLRPSS